jgi:chromosomal replication initiation ATPase DnaA
MLIHGGVVLHKSSLEPVTAVRNTRTEVLLGRASELTGISIPRIKGQEISQEAMYPRLAVCWAMRETLGMSLAMVGRQIGGRHYSSIRDACRRAEGKRKTDPAFKALCDRLEAVVG